MLAFLFDKTHYFFGRLTFLHHLGALIRFLTSFKQTFISENSTKYQKSSFLPAHTFPWLFGGHFLSHTVIPHDSKILLSTSHSSFIHKLSCLCFCNILCLKTSPTEMTSPKQLTSLPSHVYIPMFR